MAKFKTMISGLSFTECPRWHDGRLYFSDFYTHRVLAVARNGTMETIAEVPGQPSGLGFLPDGRMLIVSMRDRKIMRRELDGSLVEHADLSGLAPWYLNDMLVDYHGRAWVGNFLSRGSRPLRSRSIGLRTPRGRLYERIFGIRK
jgi:sugar lactone lactonase YvrE